jgi:thioredoxin-related protein
MNLKNNYGDNIMKVIQRTGQLFLFVLLMLFLFMSAIGQSGLRWYKWDDGVTAAYGEGKKIIVDVYTDWCGWCKKMDKASYGDAAAKELIAEYFIPIKLNGESNELVSFGSERITEAEVAKLFNVDSYPTTLVFDENLKLIYKESGYIEPKEFTRLLKRLSGN